MTADYSEAGEKGVKTADALAGCFGEQLTLLHVIENFPENMPSSVIPPEDVDPRKYLTDRVRSFL